MKLFCLLISILFLNSCGGEIKNENAEVLVEEGTDYAEPEETKAEAEDQKRHVRNSEDHVNDACLGFWVGEFEPDWSDDDQRDKERFVLDEGFYWNRNNKINISIDAIYDDSVVGHSVVAGNDRPFVGMIKSYDNNSYSINVVEPGDDRYDGKFSFTISRGKMNGTWSAYKKLQISHRKYELSKKEFNYDASQKLEQARPYANWKKVQKEKISEEGESEIYDWIEESFAGSTAKIYEVNASESLLKKEDVENLMRGDLQIIRNTIYARHGYSYKSRIYRLFFDAQPWYIPVHTDIKKELTTIEKKNIQLLLRFEKNAEEYYDYFGRG